MTRLTWTGQGAGLDYDVVSGDLSTLLASGSAGDALCQIDDSTASTWDDPRTDPAVDQAYYYLVRSQDSCAPGSYGSATAGAERLPLIDCP